MLVSVIVPVYNSEKYLKACIESILNQSYIDLQIIIINDGSKDNTTQIARELIKEDNRIIYIEQENKGVSYTRNLGIDLAKGEFIVFLDSDDTIESNYIELLVNKIRNDNLDLVTCGYTDISIYGTIKLNDFYKGNCILDKQEFINDIFKGVGGTLWGKIFKKEIINKNNIRMKPNIFMCEDMIFVLEYSIKSNTFGAIKECLYNYNRRNENSVSSKISFEYFNNLIIVMEQIEKILKENHFSKEFIDSILCERIRNLAISFSVMQHHRKYGYTKNKKINNLKYIFENKYFEKYKYLFQGRSKSEYILVKFIKEKNIRKVYYYSYYIFFISEIKRNIRKLISNGGSK